MTNLKQTLAHIAGGIVDKPEEIVIAEKIDGDHITLELSVAPDDMGKVIGKHGKIARAIRQIMKTAASNCGKKITISIKDEIEVAE